MNAEITPETVRLASNGARELAAISKCEDRPTLMLQVEAIDSLIAHATEMQAVMKARPDKPGDYVVGFANSPVRRVVAVSANLLVADSDYPVGRTVEDYGAAWYMGPLEMP